MMPSPSLGTGGGGDPYFSLLEARKHWADGKSVELIDPLSLDDDDLIACVGQMGAPIAMQEKMKGRVTIFAVSTDVSRAAYQKFLQEEKTNFLTVRDSAQKSSNLYGSFGWPESYIIDANGTIRRKIVGPIDWSRPEMIEYLSSL